MSLFPTQGREGKEMYYGTALLSAAASMRSVCRAPLHAQSVSVPCAFTPTALRDPGRGAHKAGGGGAVAAPPNPFGAPFAAPEHPILEVSLSRRRFRCFRNPAARASQPAWEGVYRFVREPRSVSLLVPPCLCH